MMYTAFTGLMVIVMTLTQPNGFEQTQTQTRPLESVEVCQSIIANYVDIDENGKATNVDKDGKVTVVLPGLNEWPYTLIYSCVERN